MNENEEEDIFKYVSQLSDINIRFTFYIVKGEKSRNKCSYISQTKTIYLDSCFVINELRNLAIETIQTSHFMIIDGDAIISGIIIRMVVI